MSTTARQVSRPVARIAAQWFLRLQYGQPSEAERQAFEHWRSSNEEHERAWALAGQLTEQMKALPRHVSRSALERPSVISRRAALGGITSLIVLASLGVGLPHTRTYGVLTADLRTGVGERRHFKLSDGTDITLNTDSAVDIQYSERARRIILRKGEIFIATAPDARPMAVQSAFGEFMPVGTQFSVRQFDDYDLLYVSQGQVNASALGKAGEQAAIKVNGHVRIDRTGLVLDPDSPSIDWVTGVLRANRMRLVDLLAEFARYRHGWLRCSPEVADLQISGAFQLNDIDAALAALAMSFPVQVRYVTRYWVTVAAV